MFPFLFILLFIAGINAEPASRYKLTCEDHPCGEEDLTATTDRGDRIRTCDLVLPNY